MRMGVLECKLHLIRCRDNQGSRLQTNGDVYFNVRDGCITRVEYNLL